MFAELEPRDGFEAMLVAQMTATHVAMTSLMRRMSFQESFQELLSNLVSKRSSCGGLILV